LSDHPNPLAAVNNEDLANRYPILNKKLISERAPGHMNMAGEVRGHYAHSAVKEFQEANGPLDQQINEWAKTMPVPYLVAGIYYAPPRCMLVYTLNLDDDDIQEMNENQEEIDRILKASRERKAAKRREDEEAAQKVHAEEEELIKLGKRCRDNHSKKGDQ
jgi:hypothetical protein